MDEVEERMGREEEGLSSVCELFLLAFIARLSPYAAMILLLSLLDMVQPELSPANRPAFEEEIGVDQETTEAIAIEASELCKPQNSRAIMSGRSGGKTGPTSSDKATASGVKRKRD